MYVCMYGGGPQSGPCTATFNDLVFPLWLTPYTSNEVQDSIYGGVIVVTWFHEELAQVTKS
jgi:hypothetical protein